MDENLKNDSQEVQPEESEQETDTSSESEEQVENEEVAKLREELAKKDEQIANLSKAKRELKKEVKKSDSTQEETKSDEPNYGKLAFLNSQSVINPDDQKIVIDEAERLKLPLTDILQMEHVKYKLKTAQEQREAQAGMPKGKGRSGGNTQHDVDYWLANGGLPDDQDLAAKVVDARMNRENKNKFSDELYVG